MSPSQQPLIRSVIFAIVLLALVAAIFFFARSRPNTIAPPREVHRRNLQLRAGIWYAPGQTNGFTGVLLDTYEDGTLRSRSTISNGLLDGLSQGWWSNNVLQVTEYYSQGVSHGKRTKYYLSGRKQSEAAVMNGKLEGLFERWHENGKLAEQVSLKNGQPDGESLAYHPDGSLKARVRLAQGKVLEQKFWGPGESTQVVGRTPVSESP